ncbi:hypothetical protein TWF696_005215 [Orbilia brochopaga]|uniref:Mitochondrial ribosomal protein S21 n=1 Tax=Orbilia brochopaga TaxID=3140254 RepID=A0AAV9V2U0_9PEZI
MNLPLRRLFLPLRLAHQASPTALGAKLGHSAARALISTSCPARQNVLTESPEISNSAAWISNPPSNAPDSNQSSSGSLPPLPTPKLPPRLNSTAGRSIAVRGGDVAGAFMQLKRICTENLIARDSNIQRFYERPGLKKKRIRRERFRRRFKESFKQMVNTVLEMKRQGI